MDRARLDIPPPESTAKIAFIIWGVMMAAVAVYGFVCWKLAVPSDDFEPNTQLINTLQMAFGGISLAVAGLIPILKKKLAGNTEAKMDFSGKPMNSNEQMQKQFISYIVAWALCESIAIYGFVLAFLSKDFQHYLPFGFAAILLMFYHRPKTA